MQKIPTIFQRESRWVVDRPRNGCEWVFEGYGKPTFKWDGTSVLLDDDLAMWKRRDVKPGQGEPVGFLISEEDSNTGRRFGWVPSSESNPSDKWHFEGLRNLDLRLPGTYELVGPKVQGNPHQMEEHRLIPHGQAYLFDVPTEFEALWRWLWSEDRQTGFEGVVWHHGDGRMAKIKRRDFLPIEVQ